jgi:hypothetical protein
MNAQSLVFWTAKKTMRLVEGRNVDRAEVLGRVEDFGRFCYDEYSPDRPAVWGVGCVRVWLGDDEIGFERPGSEFDYSPGMELCDRALKMFSGEAVGCKIVSIRPVVGEVVFCKPDGECVTVTVRSYDMARCYEHEYSDHPPPFQIRVK